MLKPQKKLLYQQTDTTPITPPLIRSTGFPTPRYLPVRHSQHLKMDRRGPLWKIADGPGVEQYLLRTFHLAVPITKPETRSDVAATRNRFGPLFVKTDQVLTPPTWNGNTKTHSWKLNPSQMNQSRMRSSKETQNNKQLQNSKNLSKKKTLAASIASRSWWKRLTRDPHDVG